MAKKRDPKEELAVLCQKVRDTVTRWKSHRENGCGDPFYPDGVNMNLLRNHLISYKRKIRELCAQLELPLPPEAFIPGLPYTDANYFADPSSERAQRIMSRPGWTCYNHENPSSGEYDETQLTLI